MIHCIIIQTVLFFPTEISVCLTDDDSSDSSSLLNVSGFLCKHALSPLQQSDTSGHQLAVAQLGAAGVRLGDGHETSNLRRGDRKKVDYLLLRVSLKK